MTFEIDLMWHQVNFKRHNIVWKNVIAIQKASARNFVGTPFDYPEMSSFSF